MTVEELHVISLSLHGVPEDIKWQDPVCFSVGNKIFLATSPDLIPPATS